jgi:hypothetical protein
MRRCEVSCGKKKLKMIAKRRIAGAAAMDIIFWAMLGSMETRGRVIKVIQERMFSK